jgi:predicted small metal-binding protein
MAYEINCASLGIAGCTQTFHGETAADVIDAARDHLKAEHGIDLPPSDVILESGINPMGEEFAESFVRGGYEGDAIIVIRRLREILSVGQSATMPHTGNIPDR